MKNKGYQDKYDNTTETDLITKTDAKWLTGGECLQLGDAGQRGDSCPRWGRVGGKEISSCTQNGARFRIHAFFISGIFYVMFSDWSWPSVTKIVESKVVDKGGLLNGSTAVLGHRRERGPQASAEPKIPTLNFRIFIKSIWWFLVSQHRDSNFPLLQFLFTENPKL